MLTGIIWLCLVLSFLFSIWRKQKEHNQNAVLVRAASHCSEVCIWEFLWRRREKFAHMHVTSTFTSQKWLTFFLLLVLLSLLERPLANASYRPTSCSYSINGFNNFLFSYILKLIGVFYRQNSNARRFRAHFWALQEVVCVLTQIWSLTSCLRRLIFRRQTSAVHLHSLTGNAGLELPHAPLFTPFLSLSVLPLMFCFCSHLLLLFEILTLIHRGRRRRKENKFSPNQRFSFHMTRNISSTLHVWTFTSLIRHS